MIINNFTNNFSQFYFDLKMIENVENFGRPLNL